MAAAPSASVPVNYRHKARFVLSPCDRLSFSIIATACGRGFFRSPFSRSSALSTMKLGLSSAIGRPIEFTFILIRFVISVDCEWSRFSDWSECSVSCGGGIQRRRRTILVEADRGGRRCVGRSEETRICNSKSCPRPAGNILTNFKILPIFPSPTPMLSCK